MQATQTLASEKDSKLRDFLTECYEALRESNRLPFPGLTEVDEDIITRQYVRPPQLFMGKFVPETPSLDQENKVLASEPSTEKFSSDVNSAQPDQDKKPTRRLVTEKALPIITSVMGTKFVRCTIRHFSMAPELCAQFLVFHPQMFRKKSDILCPKLLWTKKSERQVSRPSGLVRHADLQLDNVDKLCMYKIGAGAVAFRVVVTTLHAGGMRHTIGDDWNLFWGKRIGLNEWKRSSVYQKINHFPGSKNVGRKDLLHWNILKAKERSPVEFDFTPPTFVLPQESAAFLRYRLENAKQNQTFIVKPVASSCGKGIYLTDTIPMPWKQKASLVQQYIPQPLLIDGRKFDLRIYVALTSIQPLRLYVFEDGLVRFAPGAYPGDDQDLADIHKHVTNYSLNKHCSSTEGVEIKWDLVRLKEWLCRTMPDGKARWHAFQRDMEAIIVKTFIAIEPEVRRQCKIFIPHDERARGCFELFGFDLLLDRHFKLFLIEVNIMPSLATESDVDIDVKCKLLADLLGLVGVAAYDRKSGVTGALPGRVEGPSRKAVDSLIRSVLNTGDFSRIFQDDEGTALMEALVESEEELERRGNFRKVFPIKNSRKQYAHLFDESVSLTHFMMRWEEWKE